MRINKIYNSIIKIWYFLMSVFSSFLFFSVLYLSFKNNSLFMFGISILALITVILYIFFLWMWEKEEEKEY